MKILLLCLVAVLAAIALGSAAYQNPGTVVIQVGDWNVGTSFAFAITALVLSFLAFYFLLRTIFGLIAAPRRLNRWQERRRIAQANQRLQRGQLNLAKGRWKHAEKDFMRSVKHSSQPSLAYMGAAQAAQATGRLETRDRYLQLAHEKAAREQVSVGLTEAQLLIANQQIEKAVETLTELRKTEPKNGLVLKLLKDCYLDLHDWYNLALLAPQLEKAGAASAEEAQHLEEDAYLQIMARAVIDSQDARDLDEVWRTIPTTLRRHHKVYCAYIRYLIQYGEKGRPEQLLRRRLNKHWNEQLIYLYGFAEGRSLSDQLVYAEKWLTRYPEDATLLLTLGRLSLRSQLWGKARAYLESSAAIAPRPETYLLLGKLLEQTGETATALELFQRGLGLSVHPNQPASSTAMALTLPATDLAHPSDKTPVTTPV